MLLRRRVHNLPNSRRPGTSKLPVAEKRLIQPIEDAETYATLDEAIKAAQTWYIGLTVRTARHQPR
jgi:hypothetical protein